MEIKKTVHINATAAAVWKTLYENYGQACDWASTVNESQLRKVSGSQHGGRTCSTSLGQVSEILDHVNEEKMELSYHVDDTPFIMKSAQADWKVTPTAVNTSSVSMHMNMELATLPKILMGWMIKPKVRKDIDQTLEDLKFYVENGKQSEAKKKSDAKYFKKKGRKAA
ncbi:SRPBCC family protein [Nonlabens ponticola]|uniref:SRPBCC family protein n=1 Tax=Nonlabens ponticola TaxID=2496866 RepID=A0A3S9MZW2_9FLAO|nr:SRPBCC family protein [Nonlabens ponticola]AZQ44805.1 SRPBCC family protein [Nonlabens ponticola]